MNRIGVIDKIRRNLQSTIFHQSIPEPNSGCWIWEGATSHSGYGRISVAGEAQNAHRISYFCFSEDPGELHVLHKCDIRLCVNPDHLFVGTHLDNMRDRDMKGRRAKTAGSLNPRAILSERDVLAIRSSRDTQELLASRFGVARSTINAIKTRKIWAHI